MNTTTETTTTNPNLPRIVALVARLNQREIDHEYCPVDNPVEWPKRFQNRIYADEDVQELEDYVDQCYADRDHRKHSKVPGFRWVNGGDGGLDLRDPLSYYHDHACVFQGRSGRWEAQVGSRYLPRFTDGDKTVKLGEFDSREEAKRKVAEFFKPYTDNRDEIDTEFHIAQLEQRDLEVQRRDAEEKANLAHVAVLENIVEALGTGKRSGHSITFTHSDARVLLRRLEKLNA